MTKAEKRYKQWFVEETTKDASGSIYKTVFEGSLDACIAFLKSTSNRNRLEVWSQAWADTYYGYAPLAWKN